MITDDTRDLIRARYPATFSEAETRIKDRRCRCGKHAAEQHKDCLWHAAVSADYARDLQDILKAGRMSWRGWWRDGVRLLRRELGRKGEA